MVGVTTGELLYESPFLVVRAASLPQLLAMKLAAWRDALDREDARLLLLRMSESVDDVWQAVKPFVPKHQIDKAWYAFQDLRETLHGLA
jgi:predicted nucleotidyltransferase